ncbi:MAG: glycosyltransferase family 2 protein [Anaerolineales bacterium]
MSPPPMLSILIVNWNGGKVLPQCLQSLVAQTFQDFEVVLVDNGSTDGSVDDLEAQWPQLALYLTRLPQNLGFAVANNIGARAARGEWLALLNTDAFPTPTWLETLLTAAHQHPDNTFFASRLLQADCPDLIDGTGDVYHISGAVWNRQHNHPAHLAVAQPGEVFSPQGAAAFIRRGAFLEVGGFDESYHSYHEDIDLAFRLRLRGHRCLYVPNALVYHKGSFTTGKGSDFAVLHGHRNMVWCYFQNMPAPYVWLYLPHHLLANLLFILHISSKGQAKAILTAKWNALRGLPAIFRKRRLIQQARTASSTQILASMNRAFLAPYFLGFTARRLKREKSKE